jgi:hypothetical protein
MAGNFTTTSNATYPVVAPHTTAGGVGVAPTIGPSYYPSIYDQSGYYTGPVRSVKELEADKLLAMIYSRLRVAPTEPSPFDHIHAARVDGTDTVVVLVVNNKQHVVIEDGYELFPSDRLVTQLRLLAK